MTNTEFVLRLPQWLATVLAPESVRLDSTEARMRFVIDLAQGNIDHKTGGPFAAAVFESGTGRLVAAGVNLVESSNYSIAHAEMVAFALAQRTVGHYDLGIDGVARELVTSTEPCAMCLGAIPWSGARRVVCGARGEDACAIGFDEGAKPTDWVGALRARGIEVVQNVLRDEARAVLEDYLGSGGTIYNTRGR
ncbi:MAG: nucleoside deaminase [Sedimentisphaerales bacterium]|nr:nucleoside deaminase [Sedimentisphaerales bacterium]